MKIDLQDQRRLSLRETQGMVKYVEIMSKKTNIAIKNRILLTICGHRGKSTNIRIGERKL